MRGNVYPNFSELAYHITILCDFWRRSGSITHKDNLVRIIGNMIGIALGVENADAMARAVIAELDAMGIARTNQEVDPDGIDVVFITALLQEQVGEFIFPAKSDYGS